MASPIVTRIGQTGARGGVAGGFKVLGIPEAVAKLQGVDRLARIYLGIQMRVAAEVTAKAAQSNIHSITGNLASGTKATKLGPYTWEVTSSSKDGNVTEKNYKEYAGFVNYGWGNTPGQFYMERAAEVGKASLLAGLAILAREIKSL